MESNYVHVDEYESFLFEKKVVQYFLLLKYKCFRILSIKFIKLFACLTFLGGPYSLLSGVCDTFYFYFYFIKLFANHKIYKEL